MSCQKQPLWGIGGISFSISFPSSFLSFSFFSFSFCCCCWDFCLVIFFGFGGVEIGKGIEVLQFWDNWWYSIWLRLHIGCRTSEESMVI